MAKVDDGALDELVAHFQTLEDPRSSINRKHPLPSVLVITVLAVLAGANGPTAIAEWAEIKKEWLLARLDLPNGVPSKDVFRRVLMAVKSELFQSCFAAWVESMRSEAAARTGVERPTFAVDGKTARRSHDRAKGLKALHAVSVWASEFGLSLGQTACAEKSNEITAIPEVLKRVDLKGAVVTIDAMGTQKAIAEQIVAGGADYVLALKGNQGSIHQRAIDYINKIGEDDFEGSNVERLETVDKGHGRVETRGYVQLEVPEDFPDKELWKSLATLGMVVSHCLRDGKESVEVRYFLCSLALRVSLFAHAARAHWGIENSCHWSLDMTYREDESRIRETNLRENFAWLNRFTLSILKQHSDKKSVAMRRRRCGWGEGYLLEVVIGSTCYTLRGPG